jgi:transposase
MGRRKFTAEFKLQAVRLAEDSGKLPHQIARELGVPVNVLRRWRAEVRRQDAAADGAGAAALSPEEELRRLRRENAILLEEREILKKATAFFAKDAR